MSNKKKSTVTVDEEDEGGLYIVSEFYAELFLKNFPSIKAKNFTTTTFWNDLYKIFVKKTTSCPSYKGFPTQKSFKIHPQGFPVKTGRDKTDPRLLKMLTDFLETYSSDINDAVESFNTSGVCNLNNYLWRSDDGQVERYEKTPKKSFTIDSSESSTSPQITSPNIESHDTIVNTPPLISKINSSPIIPTIINSSSSSKRKLEDTIDVKELRTRAVKAIKMDNDLNDFKMPETSLVLQEISNCISDNEERDILKRKLELEEGFYAYCMKFYQNIIAEKKQKIDVLENQFTELKTLSDELTLYITKRQEKLKQQHEQEHDAIKDELKKLLAEELQ